MSHDPHVIVDLLVDDPGTLTTAQIRLHLQQYPTHVLHAIAEYLNLRARNRTELCDRITTYIANHRGYLALSNGSARRAWFRRALALAGKRT